MGRTLVAVIAIAIAIDVAAGGVVLYVAWHFVTKYW